MKKNNSKVCEIKNLLSNSKISIDDCFIKLLKKDLQNLLLEYFNFNENIVLNIEKRAGEYLVVFELKIQNVKLMQRLNY